jgi:DNA-binding response OmpR family regulator
MGDCVLFIDNDSQTHALVSYLQSRGFEVLTANSGQIGLRLAYGCHPRLVVLDLNLPDVDGCQVCARLRELCDIPIIVLSASRKAQDVVAALESGADDYIFKPCEEREIEARLNAVLRRGRPPQEQTIPVYDDGRLIIDVQRQMVWRKGVPLRLSPTEFRLLASLIQRCGNVASHEELLAEVWGYPCTDSLHYLSIYIRYLREKIEDDPENPVYIRTKWGIGYRFVPQASQKA